MNLSICSVYAIALVVVFFGNPQEAVSQSTVVAEIAPDELSQLRKKAEQGDANSQYFLAFRYAIGMKVAKDPAEAAKWYRKAAEQGHAGAQFSLGKMYQAGVGVPKDVAETVKWCTKAAEQGHANAQSALGEIYSSGYGVPKDADAAVKWYTKAAEQGHPVAQNNLAVLYAAGKGVAKDQAAAVKWYTKAAEQGYAIAQFNLGFIYLNGAGVPEDAAVAAKWYTKAAEQGQEAAQFNLALMYSAGHGVPKDAAAAVMWFTKAAEQGSTLAQLNLGRMYWTGIGVPKDAAAALTWYTKAAEQGDADAQTVLGIMYSSGKDVRKDAATAVRWFTKAAEQGKADAQSLLSVMYWNGEGVAANNVLAYVWSSLAAASGNEYAREGRDRIAKEMTREQIAEAQKIAAAFKPKKWEATDTTEDNQALPASVHATGSGFFVTPDGYFVTNQHVIADATRIQVRTAAGTFTADVIRSDASNDIAILKVNGSGTFTALPVRGSKGLKLADKVATLGFPNPGLQGFAAKYSSGEVAALSGPSDDPRLMQISVPIQPGNSGGPLVDSSGCVVGVVVAQLDKFATLKMTGNLPENVNYAVKGTILLGVMEAVPNLSDKVRSDSEKPLRDPAEVVKLVEAACGMVIVEK